MRLFLVACLALGACSGAESPPPPASPEQGGPADPGPDARPWQRMAARATEGRRRETERALGVLDHGRRTTVEEMLDRMARGGLGAAPLREAGALAEANVGLAPDPEWAGSGTAPAPHALYVGGLAVIAGMAIASAEADPSSAPALADTLCEMPLPQHFNSGGREDDTSARGALCRELLASLPEGTPPPDAPCCRAL
ncbi:MAG: hypothetical protein KC619_03995 [Myxococcales bacterium]|nr:hypothetical protein [Myxococcales bacterium]